MHPLLVTGVRWGKARRRKTIDLRTVTVVPASGRLSVRTAASGGTPFMGFSLCSDTKQTVFDAPSVEAGERWVWGLRDWQEFFRFHAKTA